MKWTYSIKNKLVASAVLFGLCLLVLFSHYLDRNHTDNVKSAISTLYEDRLVAEGCILKMTNGLYQIKELINTDTDHNIRNSNINHALMKIREASDIYYVTKFTDLEKTKADELLHILREVESSNLNNYSIAVETTDKALGLLNELSAIQLEVSKQIMDHAETLYLTGKTSSQFVFAIIIILLFVLQALVFASKSLVSNIKTNGPSLN